MAAGGWDMAASEQGVSSWVMSVLELAVSVHDSEDRLQCTL